MVVGLAIRPPGSGGAYSVSSGREGGSCNRPVGAAVVALVAVRPWPGRPAVRPHQGERPGPAPSSCLGRSGRGWDAQESRSVRARRPRRCTRRADRTGCRRRGCDAGRHLGWEERVRLWGTGWRTNRYQWPIHRLDHRGLGRCRHRATSRRGVSGGGGTCRSSTWYGDGVLGDAERGMGGEQAGREVERVLHGGGRGPERIVPGVERLVGDVAPAFGKRRVGEHGLDRARRDRRAEPAPPGSSRIEAPGGIAAAATARRPRPR